jgi:ABC-type nitrate/sulfonate/bicarbonate transport system substrate-binding protein
LENIRLFLLRGTCQLPGYVAYEKNFFRDQGLHVDIQIPASAWMVPDTLSAADNDFAVIPWTRVAAARLQGLMVICGSGIEEAALVVQSGMQPSEVKTVALPVAGGMKDLTAMALLDSLGGKRIEVLRQPSGDGAIIALFGKGVDAASMVEPYATMLEALGVGTVVKRTGDVWPGAPGCSLATSERLVREQPELVQRVVTAYVQAAQYVKTHPEDSAEIASRYIGVNARFIHLALRVNQPDIHAIRNKDAIEQILALMMKLNYLTAMPSGYCELSFLDRAVASLEHTDG